ncbi:MAG TPA: hypothetical protein VEF90_17765 [Xanthobacteraceae bacterium]|nr:hypothetical protein [Xanthobacteraceae bacterium]
MLIPPMNFQWSGEVMVPAYPRLADRHFVVGENYRLAPPQERSKKSHDHFFAALDKAWENLPEGLALEFPSAEDLRARALIACGYANSRQFVASSKAEAVRLAAFIRHGREYSVVAVNGCAVTEFTAQSQSLKAMGPKEFQKSKQAVLEYVAAMVGVSVEELARNSKEAA